MTLAPALHAQDQPVPEGEPGAVRISHVYRLSDFTGTVPYSDVNLHIDRGRDEVFALTGNSIRVFNAAGMETYRFEHDAALGRVFDMATDESGDILLLTYEPGIGGPDRRWYLTRCDFRGEPIETIDPSGLPPKLAGFGPNRMFYRDGRFLLVSRAQLLVVVLDRSWQYARHHDLAELLAIDDPGAEEIFGFSLDRHGNMLFTIPVRFRAYIVSPDETVRQFGAAGSAPGRFGIVSGIIADDHGHVLVADKLRRVVMVFDPWFRFITEFRAEDGHHVLQRPTDLALGNGGLVYVTQARQKGVSVFALAPMHDMLNSRNQPLQKGGASGKPAIRGETPQRGGAVKAATQNDPINLHAFESAERG